MKTYAIYSMYSIIDKFDFFNFKIKYWPINCLCFWSLDTRFSQQKSSYFNTKKKNFRKWTIRQRFFNFILCFSNKYMFLFLYIIKFQILNKIWMVFSFNFFPSNILWQGFLFSSDKNRILTVTFDRSSSTL